MSTPYNELILTDQLLPPAYLVRREGNVLTRVCPSVYPQGRGVPTLARFKVPTPPPVPGQDQGGGTQGTYSPARLGQRRGYPKVPTPPPQPGQDEGKW